jgi:hypothetical protein
VNNNSVSNKSGIKFQNKSFEFKLKQADKNSGIMPKLDYNAKQGWNVAIQIQQKIIIS